MSLIIYLHLLLLHLDVHQVEEDYYKKFKHSKYDIVYEINKKKNVEHSTMEMIKEKT